MNMHQEAFKKLELKEVETILETFNPLFKGIHFDPKETTIMAQDISFYPGLRYLDIADYSAVPPIHRFVVHGSNHAIVLDWTNEPIYRLNQDIPITLDENKACDYVRFFFSHVRGKNGRFLITESVDDIRWREEPPPAARKSISQMLLPLSVREQKTDGSYLLSVTVMFKDSLFKCDVTVAPGGLVSLDNEELLVEDIPVMDDTFGQ